MGEPLPSLFGVWYVNIGDICVTFGLIFVTL